MLQHMPYHIRVATSRHAMREFLYLPAQLHAAEPAWVPPIYSDEASMFDRRKNPAAAYCSFACWVAYDERKRPVGRIAGIINHRYNELKNERTARFSHLDGINDPALIDMLLQRVLSWAHAFEMDRVIGPFGFTDQDPEGFLVEGFDEPPAIVTYCNPKYITDTLAELGWEKFTDYVVYKVPLPATRPAIYERLLARLNRSGEFEVGEFTKKSELKDVAEPILRLMNETYTEVTGYSPLSPEEIHELTKRFMPMIDPRFVKVVYAKQQLVGFVVGVPDMAEGFRKSRGHLFPVGWYWILKSAHQAKRLDLLLGGIKKEYRGRGVDLLLGDAMIRSAEAAGFDHLDSHHELEDNAQVRAEMERWGGFVYKRYRLFRHDVPVTPSDRLFESAASAHASR